MSAGMISLEDDIAQSMEHALIFGAFLQSLSGPTPAQLWLERAGEQIRRWREEDQRNSTRDAERGPGKRADAK
jgi:hypothetical protein